MEIAGVRRRDEDGYVPEAFSGGEGAVGAGRKLELPEDVKENAISYEPVLFAKQWKAEAADVSVYDIQQRRIGDCYLLATLGALATSPEGVKRIHEMIRENRDASGKPVSYTVTFHEKAHLVEVEVPADKLPLVKSVTVDENHLEHTSWEIAAEARDAGPGMKEVWAPVIEHAFMLYKGGKGAITGGHPADAMELLTGTRGKHVTMPVEGDPRPSAVGYTPADLEADLKAKRVIVANTRSEAVLGKNSPVVPGHSFTVVGVRVENGVTYVQLHNPHGDWTQGELTKNVPLSDWRHYFDSFDVGSP